MCVQLTFGKILAFMGITYKPKKWLNSYLSNHSWPYYISMKDYKDILWRSVRPCM